MIKSFRQAVLVKPGKFEIREVPFPSLSKEQVLVKIEYAGICGSDLHTYKGKNPVVKPPVVLGHEISGEVVDIGRKNSEIKVGQKVVVFPLLACKRCYYCRKGQPNLCDNPQFVGGLGVGGGFSEYVIVPQDNVLRLLSEINTLEAVFIEPLSVVINALEKILSFCDSHDSILAIIGCGTIGLLASQVAKIFEFKKIIAIDIIAKKVNLAQDLGANLGVTISSVAPENHFNQIQQFLKDEKIDVVMDCIGGEQSLDMALKLVRKGGLIELVGVPTEKCQVDLNRIILQERVLQGVYIYLRRHFYQAQKFIKNNKVKLIPLISKKIKLNRINKAFNLIVQKKGQLIKVVLTNS